MGCSHSGISASVGWRAALLYWLLGVILLLGGSPLSAAERRSPVVVAVRKVSPAVVNIRTEKIVQMREDAFSSFFRDPFFDRFFRDFLEPRRPRYEQHNLGSGVIFDSAGHVLTNWHVIAKASRISVILVDDRTFEAELVGSDPTTDLAVLKIKTDEKLPFVPLGESGDLMIGETIIAIGNPFGFSHTVTTGVISATNRSFQSEGQVFHDFIQLDASINPGNSGGPLLDINGRLIGINTAIYSAAQGIGFAIPISKVRRVVDDLLRFGEVHPAWIGLQIQPLTEELARQFGHDSAAGVLVNDIEANGPAMQAGLQRGDIITHVDGRRVSDAPTFETAIEQFTANDRIPVSVLRNGTSVQLQIQAKELPLESARGRAERLLGLSVEAVTKETRRQYGLYAREGVVITGLVRRGLAHRLGLAPGDVILQLDKQAISNLNDFQRVLLKLRRNSRILIVVQRGVERHQLIVKLS